MFETKHIQTLPLPSYFCFHFNLEKKVKQPHGIMWLLFGYPNFLGGSNLGGNLGDNNEK